MLALSVCVCGYADGSIQLKVLLRLRTASHSMAVWTLRLISQQMPIKAQFIDYNFKYNIKRDQCFWFLLKTYSGNVKKGEAIVNKVTMHTSQKPQFCKRQLDLKKAGTLLIKQNVIVCQFFLTHTQLKTAQRHISCFTPSTSLIFVNIQ